MDDPICVLCGKPVENFEYGDPKVCEACWKCPFCGVGTEYIDEGELSEGLIIDGFSGEQHVSCLCCGGIWGVKEFERAMTRKQNMIVCPTCKGKGHIHQKSKGGKK